MSRFDPKPIIDRLERFAEVLPALARVADPRDAAWKPPHGAWSVLEICCHMLDEEVDDFRTRLRLTQEDPASPWPGLDPESRATRDRYNEQNLAVVLDAFVRERRSSVAWLRELAGRRPDWAVAHNHPRIGPITAGDLLVAWCAHDALHARQIAKRLFEIAARDGQPHGFRTLYAGEWGA